MAKRSAENLLETCTELKKLGYDKRTQNTLKTLLSEWDSLRGAEARIKAIKDEIKLITEGGVSIRVGELCVVSRWNNGRKTFDATKAIEAGITPAQIEAAMKEGQGFYSFEFATLKEAE